MTMTPTQLAALAARGIIIGDARPIAFTYVPHPRKTKTMSPPASPSPAAPTRTPLPPDVPKAQADIMKALVLPPDSDAATVRAAFDAVFPPATSAPNPNAQAAEAKAAGITASQLAAIRATPGATVQNFLSVRRAMKGIVR